LATLIISQKYTQDVPYRNLDWSYITPFSLEDINLMERQLLYKLNYDLKFNEAEVANLYFFTISKMINNTSFNYTYNSFPNIESIYSDPSICVIDTTHSTTYKKDISNDSILSSNDINNIKSNYNHKNNHIHHNMNISNNKNNNNSNNNNVNRNRKPHVVLSNEEQKDNYNKNINKNSNKQSSSEVDNYVHKFNYHESETNTKISTISSQSHSSNLNILNNLNINKNNVINNINLNYYTKDSGSLYNSSNSSNSTSLNNDSTKNKNININLMKNYENNINDNLKNPNININLNSSQKNKIVFINEKSEISSNCYNNYKNNLNECKDNENVNLNSVFCYNISQTSDSSDDDEYFFEKYENKSFNKNINKNLNTNYYESNVMKNIKNNIITPSSNNNSINSKNNINKNDLNNTTKTTSSSINSSINNSSYYYQQLLSNSNTTSSKSSNINTMNFSSAMKNTCDKNCNLNMINNNNNDLSFTKGHDYSTNVDVNRNTYNNRKISFSSNSSNAYDYRYNNYNYNGYVGNNVNTLKTEDLSSNSNMLNPNVCKNIEINNYGYSQMNQYSYNQYNSNNNSGIIINNINSNDNNNNINNNDNSNIINENNSASKNNTNVSSYSSSSIISCDKSEHRIYPCNENSILSDVTKAFSSIKLLSSSSSSSSLYSSDKNDNASCKYDASSTSSFINVNLNQPNSTKNIPSLNTAFSRVENNYVPSNEDSYRERKNDSSNYSNTSNNSYKIVFNNSGNNEKDISKIKQNSNYYNPAIMINNTLKSIYSSNNDVTDNKSINNDTNKQSNIEHKTPNNNIYVGNTHGIHNNYQYQSKDNHQNQFIVNNNDPVIYDSALSHINNINPINMYKSYSNNNNNNNNNVQNNFHNSNTSSCHDNVNTNNEFIKVSYINNNNYPPNAQQQPSSNSLLNPNSINYSLTSNVNSAIPYINATTLTDTKKINSNFSPFNLNSYGNGSSNSINISNTSIHQGVVKDNGNSSNPQNYNYSKNSSDVESFHDANKNQYKMDEQDILYGDIFYSKRKYVNFDELLNEKEKNMNESRYNNSIDINDDIEIKGDDSDSLYHTESENYFSQDEEYESISSKFKFNTVKNKKLEEDQINIIHGYNDSENYFSQESDIMFNETSITERIIDNQKINMSLNNDNKNEPTSSINDDSSNNMEEVAITNKDSGLPNKKEKIFKFCSSCSSLSTLSEEDMKKSKMKYKNNLYYKTENTVEKIKNDSPLFNKIIDDQEKKDNPDVEEKKPVFSEYNYLENKIRPLCNYNSNDNANKNENRDNITTTTATITSTTATTTNNNNNNNYNNNNNVFIQCEDNKISTNKQKSNINNSNNKSVTQNNKLTHTINIGECNDCSKDGHNDKQKTSTIKKETSFLSKVINDTIHEINSHKNNINNNISTFTSLFSSSKSKSANKTEYEPSTSIPSIKIENISVFPNDQNERNVENTVINDSDNTTRNNNSTSTIVNKNNNDNNKDIRINNINNNNNGNLNNISVSNNSSFNKTSHTDHNVVNNNHHQNCNDNMNTNNESIVNNDINKSNKGNSENPFLSPHGIPRSSSSLVSSDSQKSLNQCKTVFEYISSKEKKLKNGQNSNAKNGNASSNSSNESLTKVDNSVPKPKPNIIYHNHSDSQINNKNINANSTTTATATTTTNSQMKSQNETTNLFEHDDNNEDNHNGNLREDQSTEYESSYLNDTPSITSKIQRLDDMLEYCSLKHNVILNNSNCSSKKEGIYHSNSNESDLNNEKSYFNTIHNNKISGFTSNSLNNLSSLSSNHILSNNRLSQNYHSTDQKPFIDNTSNLTLISDKDENEHCYSFPPTNYGFSESFNIEGKGTTSDSMLKHSIYLKQDSTNSSHTILQDKEEDIQYFNNSIGCFTYGQSSSSSQFNINSNNGSNNHLNHFEHPSSDANQPYQINFSYDTENSYQAMDYNNRGYFNNSGSSNNLMPNNHYLHPNYNMSNHDEMYYRNTNYPPRNTLDPYTLHCYNNKSTDSFMNSTTSSMYNSSLSSPMNMSKSPHNPISNVPTNGFRGLHKSQRIENFQYYNRSSSGESVNNNI